MPFQQLLGYVYHHVPTELFWDGNAYRFCAGDGEDPTCIDHYIIMNPVDHGMYMDVNILTGIPHGCLYTDPMISKLDLNAVFHKK